MADITTAIIGGIASIISAVVVLIVKHFLDIKKNASPIEDDVRTAVAGKWKGQLRQTLNSNTLLIEFQFDLKVSSLGAIEGEGSIAHDKELYLFTVHGDYKSNRFIKLDYANKNKSIQQFGTFILEVSDNCKELDGQLAGYGPISGKVISANIHMTKSN